MKRISDANGFGALGLRRLSLRGHLRVFAALLFLSLTGCSAAIAGNLDRLAWFNIQPQTLDKALVQFGVQAHIQIVFASKVAMSRIRTRALKGTYTARQALSNLLRGSEYGFVQEGNTTEIIPNSWTPSRMRGRYDGKADPTQKTVVPTETRTDAMTTADPPENGAAKAHKVTALQVVIVTGTHIRGAPQSSPVTTITRQDIERSGYTTVGDVIRSLPDNFGNTGPQTIIGSAPNASPSLSGAPSPNLYGLGAGSTLTLVDGQRLAVDSITGSVDISLIPLPVIDHIDVLTGGASAIYGSDAVAGVVNIAVKRDFNGAKTTLLGGGTTDGGGTERYANQMLGKAWSTGGVLLDYESDEQNPVLASQRDYTQSAGSVTTTLPATSRSSVFMNAHQDIGTVSTFITGLYTHRTVQDAFSNGSMYPSETSEAAVHQYAADGGLNASLPASWFLSVVGDFSEERTAVASTVLSSPPAPAPLLGEEGQLRSVEATANGPVFALPSGAMHGAVGAGYRAETYNDEAGGISDTPGARRTVKYAYGELAVPLLDRSMKGWRQALRLDASGRFEQYSDFGRESVPKIGLVYVPCQSISIRGTWGKAFRAPPLYQVYNSSALLYFPLPDPSSPIGISNALITSGGNRELRPETAKTWTVGIDYASRAARGLTASVTYFNIAYRERIGQLSNLFAALTDPLNAPFVTRAPSEAYVQNLLNSATSILNLTGSPINPASVPVVVDYDYVNVAAEDVAGLEITLKYHKTWGVGQVEPFVNGAFIDLRQKLVPEAMESEISGQVFEPAKIRARGGVSWLIRQWVVTGVVNYSGAEINTYQETSPHVPSWSTADFSVAWNANGAGVLGGLQASVAVQNAFNRDPPFVEFDQFVPGIHYDPLNANALGRVVRVGVSWTFH